MALVIADRVRETTTTTGTGAITLAGAVTGCRAFSSAIGNTNTTYYTIADQGGANWEVGLGTYTSAGNTLARTTVLSSSNAGALVAFPAGTKDVFVTLPSSVAASITNPTYLPLAGGTMTGAITFNAGQTITGYLPTTGGTMTGAITFNAGQTITGYLPTTGGTLTGQLVFAAGQAFAGTLPLAGGTLTGQLVFAAGQAFAGTLPLAGGTVTGQLVLPGSSSVIGAILTSAAEVTTIAATAATGIINYDATTQSVLYYTTSASANWTVNVRASSGTTLNTALAIGRSITLAFMVTQGATAFYNTAVTIDSVSVTPKWQGGTAPTAGNAAGIDVYTYTITKTASATYIILASLTQFK